MNERNMPKIGDFDKYREGGGLEAELGANAVEELLRGLTPEQLECLTGVKRGGFEHLKPDNSTSSEIS